MLAQNVLEAGAEGQKEGGARAGQPPAEPDHRSGKNVRSSPPSARKNVIVLSGAASEDIRLSRLAGRRPAEGRRPAGGGARCIESEDDDSEVDGSAILDCVTANGIN